MAKSTARMLGSCPRSFWHFWARASRKSWALTIAAFDGPRRRRRLDPVVDLEERRRGAAAVGPARELLQRVERVGGFLDRLEGRVVPGDARRVVLTEDDQALVGVDHLAQRREGRRHAAAVDEAVEPALAERRLDLRRRHVVFDHEDEHLARVLDEEVPHALQHRRRAARRRARRTHGRGRRPADRRAARSSGRGCASRRRRPPCRRPCRTWPRTQPRPRGRS